jgi:tRNA (guanine-N7-)-methyltransferase
MQRSDTSFRLRSFVRRDGRITAVQRRAWMMLWDRYGLPLTTHCIDYKQVFGRVAPCLLEIGFGSGQSLLAAAKQHTDKDFIGVEVYKPGVGAVLHGIELNGLTNLRIYYADVMDVLETCIPRASLHGVQIFFPDPWPKRRHHARRLIQSAFVQLVVDKLQSNGMLHLATDWQDYAQHIQRVLSRQKELICLADSQYDATPSIRSPYRPIVSKFERRSQCEGRSVWEWQFIKRSELAESSR